MRLLFTGNTHPRDNVKGCLFRIYEKDDRVLVCKLVSWETGEQLANDEIASSDLGHWLLDKVDW